MGVHLATDTAVRSSRQTLSSARLSRSALSHCFSAGGPELVLRSRLVGSDPAASNNGSCENRGFKLTHYRLLAEIHLPYIQFPFGDRTVMVPSSAFAVTSSPRRLLRTCVIVTPPQPPLAGWLDVAKCPLPSRAKISRFLLSAHETAISCRPLP